MSPLWVAVLLSCTTPPSPAEQARAYADAASLASTDPQGAATRCRHTGEAAAECLAMTAAATAPADPEAAEALCLEIEAGPWRDECAFLVAEALVEPLGGERAAAACAGAGRYAENCMTHVWRAHAQRLLREEEDPGEAAARFSAAETWADGILAPGRERQARMWNKFYDGALADQGLDAGWCERFPPELGGRCERELPAALRRALNREAREAQTRGTPLDAAVLCGSGELHERVEAATGLRYAPSSTLDAIAERGIAPYCGGGPPRR